MVVLSKRWNSLLHIPPRQESPQTVMFADDIAICSESGEVKVGTRDEGAEVSRNKTQDGVHVHERGKAAEWSGSECRCSEGG